MLPYQETAMTIDHGLRNEISVIRDEDNENKPTQTDLDDIETSKAQRLLKKAAKFLVSHIGLVGLVVVYAIAGGFLFELLEQHQEKLYCQEAEGAHSVQVNKLKQVIVAYLQYNTTGSSQSSQISYPWPKDNSTEATEKIKKMLYEYRDFVIETGIKYRYNGDDCSVINKWTYPNSLLFAITIITTIGYGNITPMTWEGQICCICYATIGIPIFLLCVANISGVLGEMFRLLYAKVICRSCYMIKKQRALARKAKLEEETGMSINRMNSGGWNLQDNNSPRKPTRNLMLNRAIDDDDQLQSQRVTVPLTITMLIIAAYIWAGSLIFHKFEEWSITQAGYFCFITLATIGFGDFVPGQRKEDPKAGAKLIVGAIYVLFGMAILAMCFDLMQEEIVAKFRWLGRKIGIIEKEEEGMVDQKYEKFEHRGRTPLSAYVADSTQAIVINGKTPDDDGETGWSTQRSSAGTRKFSPRNNNARVHPLETGSNEGTLHQRATNVKTN